jgi:flagellar hook-basal body complex protein FliE
MSTPIAAIGAIDPVASAAATAAAAPSAPQRPFDLMEQVVGQVNDKVVNADNQVRALALGQTDHLHDVMLALEDARISMGLMVQVRNRLVDAYQDLMRMQL